MTFRLRARLLAAAALCLCVLWVTASAQQPPAQGRPAAQAAAAAQPPVAAVQTASLLPPPVNMSDDPLLKDFRFRSIGPASMGGRIDDFAVVEKDPSSIYIGFATGGVWKTTNNGTTWAPIFDTYAVCSIGALAVDQKNPTVVWVGTGEANNRQSASFGDGIYKSTDGGKTFANVGLKETQSIARIVIDPKDSNVVYVAALGHLFGPNPERGLYKTIDGGRTWNAIKAIDADTGFTDIVIDPSDSKILYASSYQRRRVPWGFNGGGPGSGLWKTADAGKTWTRITGNGFPAGLLGRIGLAVSRSKPNVVYAQIEVGASAGTGGNVTADGKEPPPGAGAGAGGGGQRGAQAGQAPPPPDPTKSGVWRSDDKGKTWKVMSNNNDRPMYYSQIRVDPTNDQVVYTMGAPFHKSVDGGKTFRTVQGIAHSDHHAMWIDPSNPKHLIIGNDGGLDVSYDQAETWEFVNTMPVGQFYAVSADMRKPYYVYGGLQDNGTWGGPSATRSTTGITNAEWFRVGGGDGFYTQVDPTDYNTVYVESQDGNVQRLDLRQGSRGANIRPRAAARPGQGQRGQAPAAGEVQPGQAAAAPAIPQFGGAQAQRSNIVPPPPEGEPFRFFWNTPILLSPHNPRLVYIGANQLFRSFDRGDSYMGSPDLTKNISRFVRPIMGVAGDAPMASKHDGAGAFSSIITISESPAQPGIVWVGTNDGNVQVTRDGGASWKNVVDNVQGVPKETHVSRVEASHFDAGTCYVSFDGHRTDDHKPYVYVTRDFGATWKPLANNLPAVGNVNVIKEDPKSKNLLYLGTEYGFYVSLNGGVEWKKFMNGMPTVRIDDVMVHPRDNDLIVATHGRSIYILDDITALQQLSDAVMKEDVRLFDVRPGTQWKQDITLARSIGGSKNYAGENPREGVAISYYLKAAATGDVKLTITDYSGRVVRTFDGPKAAGLNRIQWDFRGNPAAQPAGAQQRGGGGGGGRGGFGGPMVEPGSYLLKLAAGGKDYTTRIVIEADDFGR